MSKSQLCVRCNKPMEAHNSGVGCTIFTLSSIPDPTTTSELLARQAHEHNQRVTDLIRYNSEQVIARRTLAAKVAILDRALEQVEDLLAHWLTDNLPDDGVFEDIPEIDSIRNIAQDAREDARNIDPSAFGKA